MAFVCAYILGSLPLGCQMDGGENISRNNKRPRRMAGHLRRQKNAVTSHLHYGRNYGTLPPARSLAPRRRRCVMAAAAAGESLAWQLQTGARARVRVIFDAPLFLLCTGVLARQILALKLWRVPTEPKALQWGKLGGSKEFFYCGGSPWQFSLLTLRGWNAHVIIKGQRPPQKAPQPLLCKRTMAHRAITPLGALFLNPLSSAILNSCLSTKFGTAAARANDGGTQ